MQELSKRSSEVYKLQTDLATSSSRKEQMIKDKENLEKRIHNKFHVISYIYQSI